MLTAAPKADPFVGPDQHALEAMLVSFEPATAGVGSAGPAGSITH
jgi:hypothetical protein